MKTWNIVRPMITEKTTLLANLTDPDADVGNTIGLWKEICVIGSGLYMFVCAILWMNVYIYTLLTIAIEICKLFFMQYQVQQKQF